MQAQKKSHRHDVVSNFLWHIPARRKIPYMVHQLCHKDFLDCKALSETLIKNRTNNKNGETVNWMKIKVLRFQKNSHSIQYKYRYGEHFSSLNIIGRGRHAALVDILEPVSCYKSRLPISSAKKADLPALCKAAVIPREHQHFFRCLPSSKKKVVTSIFM